MKPHTHQLERGRFFVRSDLHSIDFASSRACFVCRTDVSLYLESRLEQHSMMLSVFCLLHSAAIAVDSVVVVSAAAFALPAAAAAAAVAITVAR